MNWHPAHHPKIEGPSEHETLCAELLGDWKLKRVLGFVAVDPLPQRARYAAAQRHAAHLVHARFFLEIRAAEARAQAKDVSRRGLRLLAGGKA